jgi:hypothetical protein
VQGVQATPSEVCEGELFLRGAETMPARARKSVARQKMNEHHDPHANGLGVPKPSDQDELVGALPKEVGVLLMIVGIGGLLLPGPVGSPFFLLGLVTLWPSAFGKLEAAFQNRFPRIHREGMRQVKRYLTDLERRYPSSA